LSTFSKFESDLEFEQSIHSQPIMGVSPEAQAPAEYVDEKNQAPYNESDHEKPILSDAQAGVVAMEAALSVWTKWEMIAAYVL